MYTLLIEYGQNNKMLSAASDAKTVIFKMRKNFLLQVNEPEIDWKVLTYLHFYELGFLAPLNFSHQPIPSATSLSYLIRKYTFV